MSHLTFRSDKIVVLGTGMSGTGYMRRVFQQLGYKASHEDVYSAWGYLGWRDYQVSVSSYAAGYPLLPGSTYLHVVRDPLLCLRAHMSNHVNEDGYGFWFLDGDADQTHPAAPHARWWRGHLPQWVYEAPDVMARPMRFLHYWTFHIEEKIASFPYVYRSKLEHVNPELLRSVCGRDDLDYAGALSRVDTSTNSKPRAFDNLSWQDVERHPEGYLLKEVQDFYDTLW